MVSFPIVHPDIMNVQGSGFNVDKKKTILTECSCRVV